MLLAIVEFLHVFLRELAHKTLTIKFSERMTLALSPSLYWFGKVTNPFITLLNGSSRLLIRIFGVKPARHETVDSEEEIKLIVTQSYEKKINQTELEFLENIFVYDAYKNDIMIPKEKIVSLEKKMTIVEVVSD
ncbi:CNNM domain-containing protein [Micrococcus luteus]|uniref:CNNM domain-containing protein n=1 Tax=Bacillati TaxID=1783272 RepID=UPI0026CEF648